MVVTEDLEFGDESLTAHAQRHHKLQLEDHTH